MAESREPPSSSLMEALTLLRRGDAAGAEAAARMALAEKPTSGDALNLLAVLAQGRKQLNEAIDWSRQAVSAEPRKPEFWKNLGLLLQEARQIDEAIAAFRQSVTADPRYAEGWFNLGNALLSLRRADEAVEAFRKAVELRPTYAEAHNNLGAIYRDQGHLRQALECGRTMVRLKPHEAGLHVNLGSLYRDVDRLDDAIECYQKALEIAPGQIDALQSLGHLYLSQQRFADADNCFRKVLELMPTSAVASVNVGRVAQSRRRHAEAEEFYRRAIVQQPRHVEALNLLGTVLQEQSKVADAVGMYRQALAMDQTFCGAWNNLGLALVHQGNYDEAIESYGAALRYRPDLYDVHNNLGNAYKDIGRFAEAEAAYKKAMFFRPDLPDAHWNLGLLELARGEFRSGFLRYEWRRVRFREQLRRMRRPLWDGYDIKGKTILLHAEQGLGDTIQFARYVPMVAERGARVIVECDGGLKPMVQSVLQGKGEVLAHGEPLPNFDIQAPLLSLAVAFDTTLETIPVEVPYMHADVARSAAWAQRVAEHPGLKVGLVWAGSKLHKNDQNRSIPFAAYLPLLQQFGHNGAARKCTFFNLQKGEESHQPDGKTEGAAWVDWTSELKDWGETSALVANLDVVITVDSAVAHLVGALGRRIWTLVPFNADWRWLMNRDDSPWYPTMRLFRQSGYGQWDEVIARISDALSQLEPDQPASA